MSAEQLLTLREQERLVATVEELGRQLRTEKTARAEAEERAERLVVDVHNLQTDLLKKNRQINDLARARNERREVSPRKDEIEFVFRAWYDAIVERNERRKTATLGDRRWKVIEDALRKGFDREVLARAAVGIAKHPYVIDGKSYDELHIALRDEVRIEHFASVADEEPEQDAHGAEVVHVVAPAGGDAPVFPAADFKLSPLERATAALADEFGRDAVEPVWNEELGRVDMVWSTCPLEPSPSGRPLCLTETARDGRLALVCAHGHAHDDLLQAVQELEGRYEGRFERAKAAAGLCRLAWAKALAAAKEDLAARAAA